MSHSVRYDWRDPCDDVTSAGTAAFGLIHCLANDTSTAVAASGRCEQTTPSVDAMGLTKNWSAHPKLSYVAMRTLHQQLSNGEMQYVGRLESGSSDIGSVLRSLHISSSRHKWWSVANTHHPDRCLDTCRHTGSWPSPNAWRSLRYTVERGLPDGSTAACGGNY